MTEPTAPDPMDFGLRDVRRPFCYQTHDALDAIRAHFTGPKRATAIGVYTALTEHANRNGGHPARGGFHAKRRDLADSIGLSLDSLDRYLKGLVDAGVLAIERRMDGNQNLPNLWVLVEVGVGAPVPPGGRTHAARVAAPVRPIARASIQALLRKDKELESSNEDSRELTESAWAVGAVYDHWRTQRSKTSTRYNKISKQRAQKIRSRLKDGFSVVDLKHAIDAVALDPWPDRRKHDDITIIFRSREQVDKFLDLRDGSSRSNPADYEW